ncbi:MAG: pseudouridine synthase [Cyanobacteria bacterium P01_H01_bin.162]
MAERLQKVLSGWGIASRRHAENLIKAGRVSVNGQVAELGQKANPEHDRIQLDGQELNAQNHPESHYYLLNKPLRVVSTCHDPQGRKTVLAFLPPNVIHNQGIHPVGRLDYNSTGALLLTNDGDLTYRLTHPRHHFPKIYRVMVAGQPSAATLDHWRRGVRLGDRPTQPAQVTIVPPASPHQTELEIVLWEGQNRQIRRTAEQLGHPVKQLHRLAVGPIALGDLAPGKIRPLTRPELKQLRQVSTQTSAPSNVTES